MSFLGRLGGVVSRLGSLAGKAVKPLASIAAPVAGAVGAVANAFLPAPAAKLVSTVAQKASDYITSGKAAQIADKVARAGMALSGMKSILPEGM